eukprot:CAMPEP_0206046948 /NCGR_PEP_ID=MMETSP1466-20131121/19983_1 /ASSEMBLY_ACC=CAM_ASM_001126 /TAXON_ID=44452 /ORGANISM="Pavlova gyrans, Strain CCMP608" /LENGTH=153 /DNA_ID=CAMNT_0053421951 /DNA_START=134 /DNA_END=595 /DNA_ORIENTATION=+
MDAKSKSMGAQLDKVIWPAQKVIQELHGKMIEDFPQTEPNHVIRHVLTGGGPSRSAYAADLHKVAKDFTDSRETLALRAPCPAERTAQEPRNLIFPTGWLDAQPLREQEVAARKARDELQQSSESLQKAVDQHNELARAAFAHLNERVRPAAT